MNCPYSKIQKPLHNLQKHRGIPASAWKPILSCTQRCWRCGTGRITNSDAPEQSPSPDGGVIPAMFWRPARRGGESNDVRIDGLNTRRSPIKHFGDDSQKTTGLL